MDLKPNYVRFSPDFRVQYYQEFGEHVYNISRYVLVHKSLGVFYFIGKEPNYIEQKILRALGKPRVYVVRSDYMEEWLEDGHFLGDPILLWDGKWTDIWKDYMIPPYHPDYKRREEAGGGKGQPL
jgi:hypothetical protein